MALLINKKLNVRHEFAGSVVLGRAEDAGLRLDYNTVSKRHVQITERDGKWYAEDLGSSNFTYVNGDKISRSELQSGDYLRLDTYPLVFFATEPPQLPEISATDTAGNAQQRLPITKPVLRIGRRLTGNHILIADPAVSSHHLELRRSGRKWICYPAKDGLKILVNDHPATPGAAINPGDKIRIGATELEISIQVIKEYAEVAKVHRRLEELYGTLRMQSRTLQEVIRENMPAFHSMHEWDKMFFEVFAMVDQSRKELEQISETLRQLIPSMEGREADNIFIAQGVNTARRCTNLTNYLDLILHRNKLVEIGSCDLTQQRDLISKLYEDVKGCIQQDHPTLRLS